MTQTSAIDGREVVTLPDGRTLSYLVLGDPDGVPVIFTIGTPSSAAGARAFGPAAARAGVKLLAVDKPGYGRSTRVPWRTLEQYGADVVALADALGLERVAVAGQSGGGPHAIAAAHALGSRASGLLLLASGGPADADWVRYNPLIRLAGFARRRARWLMPLPTGLVRALMGNQERAEKLIARQAKSLSDAERAVMEGPEAKAIISGCVEAFADGLGAAGDEFGAIGLPWTFRLEDVVAPTEVFHGTEDKSCPIEIGRGLTQRIPNARFHELPGQGHAFFGPELDEAMASIRALATA